MSQDSLADLAILRRAALDAGRVVMDVFDSDFAVDLKADQSPVTEADRRAEAVILEALGKTFPGIAVVAEEQVAAGIVPTDLGRLFFLVDPLDGSKEFINRRSDFTVNIGLVAGGVPVAGVVYAPRRGVVYWGDGAGAARADVRDFVAGEPCAITVRQTGGDVIAVASRSHPTPATDAFLKKCGMRDCVSVGSSLKFCLVAEGTADVYPRFGRTMEWDTAAGDAVLRAAGGRTRCVDGTPLAYGKRGRRDDADFANPHFVADTACDFYTL